MRQRGRVPVLGATFTARSEPDRTHAKTVWTSTPSSTASSGGVLYVGELIVGPPGDRGRRVVSTGPRAAGLAVDALRHVPGLDRRPARSESVVAASQGPRCLTKPHTLTANRGYLRTGPPSAH